MEEIAVKSTWQNYPIDYPKRIKIDLSFTEEQFERLKQGLIPREMEDKWFIYYENRWIYFHRSWTGYGTYKAEILNVGDNYQIKEFWVERNRKKYSNKNDDADINDFFYLIAVGLLGIDTSSTTKENPKSGIDCITGWSKFGNLSASWAPTPSSKLGNTILYGMDATKSVLFGVAVGDALGVPVEFKSREYLEKTPVSDMMGYGTYDEPAGTFSDDSSLTFCMAEALTDDFDVSEIGWNFVRWLFLNYWTATGRVFDVGNATREAITRIRQDVPAELAGSADCSSNGNGSLMRILPLLFYLHGKPIEERFEITKKVSSITHRHIRSVIACFYYLEFAAQLYEGIDKFNVYQNLQQQIPSFLQSIGVDQHQINSFDQLFIGNIHELGERYIESSGYVLHTLKASIWCLLNTDNYKAAVLKAVNLGEDTDTTGAVTGGLAGLLYGFSNIPEKWMTKLAKAKDIENLAERLAKKLVI
ncbi:ADP-ribosylglycohydrolase family protein [Sunxiuqinia rutila]|uniref:ADP-ribosylglycohydrolase family protein n=1 Tax=Sunxiuqinia rutila TaxID=1397841 RepID=UPI003D35A34A